MLLLYPPVAKLSEPPAGIARLTGALRHHGISCKAVDASYESFIYTYNKSVKKEDTWTRRACKNRIKNLTFLQSDEAYKHINKYKSSISNVNRVLFASSESGNPIISLANYRDNNLSPLKSDDLIWSANHPERNVYYPYFKKRLTDLYKTSSDTHFGFSINYLSQALCAFAMIGFLKKHNPNITIIAGGGLITSWMRRPEFKNPFSRFIDRLICGEGEKTLLDLYGIRLTKKKYLPDYDDFKENNYISPFPILPYSASGGCFWSKCRFCPERSEKNPYTPVKPDTGISQLQDLIRKYQPGMIHMLDNAVSPALITEMISRRFSHPWYGFVRVTRHLADPEFVQQLKQTGCTMLKLGLESGDQGVLDSMEKGARVTQASQILKNLNKAGILTYVYLLFGTPTENEESAIKTLEFTKKNSRYISFLNISIFNLPVLSSETTGLKTQNFYEADLGLYREFEHPHGWNRKNIRAFLQDRFKKVPEIAQIIRNDPPVFTSNHAALFRVLNKKTC